MRSMCPHCQKDEPYELEDGDRHFLCGKIMYGTAPLHYVDEAKLPGPQLINPAISGRYDREQIGYLLGSAHRTVEGYAASGLLGSNVLINSKCFHPVDNVDAFVERKKEEPRFAYLACVYGVSFVDGELISTGKATKISGLTYKWVEELVKAGKVSGFTSSRPFVLNRSSFQQYLDHHPTSSA